MNPINGIIQFNKDRNLTTFNGLAEYKMLESELNEFTVGLAYGDTHEAVDALCDIIVVAVGALYKLGYDPTTALAETVKEISSRRGNFNTETGKWEKDLKQDPNTLYKADYTSAER